jgi:hypothetical protein
MESVRLLLVKQPILKSILDPVGNIVQEPVGTLIESLITLLPVIVGVVVSEL